MPQVFLIAKPILDDGTGASRPHAVYKPSEVVMDFADNRGSITYQAFHDTAAILAGEQPIPTCQVGVQLDAAKFAVCANLDQPAGKFGANVTSAMAQITSAVQSADTGAKDALGNPVMASAFSGGTIITLDTDTGAVTVVGSIP